jgi:hypothetical protein
MTAGWIPTVGEVVRVPRERGTITALKSTGRVRLVVPPFARVLVTYGRKMQADVPYRIAELRRIRTSSRRLAR